MLESDVYVRLADPSIPRGTTMHLTLLKLRCQQGFTTITLMGVLAVGGC